MESPNQAAFLNLYSELCKRKTIDLWSVLTISGLYLVRGNYIYKEVRLIW